MLSSPFRNAARRLHRGMIPCQRSTCLKQTIVRWQHHQAFIALGSNLGDRLDTIERAYSALAQQPGIRVLRTSSLYETAPVGVVDQPQFLNGVCQVETSLDPHTLLNRMQEIENGLDRVRDVRWGPRTIDLDLLLYDREIISSARLDVPHPRMLQREFVLRPLCDIIPDTVIPTISGDIPLGTLLEQFPQLDKTMTSTVSLAPSNSIPATSPTRRTQVMSILNVTPDSFSDGGLHDPKQQNQLEATITSHIDNGATIIDIGGQSSRPNAAPITVDEELSRVIPAVEASKRVVQRLGRADIAISIDTYRAPVARAAVSAGAQILNDVSAGQFDKDMLSTVADLGCRVVLMHMRGQPSTMTSKTNTSYPQGLIATVAAELRARIADAEEAGIPRWRIMLDPGIGFAKTASQNLELLRRFSVLRGAPGLLNLPWVVGSSRKGFVGQFTGCGIPAERDWGTAATVAAAVQGGADVVRIHNVRDMRAVVDMSNAIWRTADSEQQV